MPSTSSVGFCNFRAIYRKAGVAVCTHARISPLINGSTTDEPHWCLVINQGLDFARRLAVGRLPVFLMILTVMSSAG